MMTWAVGKWTRQKREYIDIRVRSVTPFVLHTPYCGFLHVQAEIIDFAIGFSQLTVFASTTTPFPSDIETGWVNVIGGLFAPIYVCPESDGGNVTVWFLVVSTYGSGTDVPLYFTVDTDRPSLPRLPPRKIGSQDPTFSNHTNFPPYPSWYAWASGAFQLTCQTPNSLLPSVFTCMLGCVDFACCRPVFPAFPSYPVNNSLTLAPAPHLLQTDVRYYFVPANYSATIGASRRLSLVLILSQAIDGQVTAGELGLDWETYLPTCVVSSDLSSIGTSDGRWLGSSTFHLDRVQSSCNYDEFHLVAQQLDMLSNSLSTASTVFEVSSLRYQADLLTFSDAWIGCFDYVGSDLLNSTEAPRSLSSTTLCPTYDEADPCCNSLLWTQCCVPRSIDFTVSKYTPATETIGQCPNSICDMPLASTFAVNREYVESRACTTSTNAAATVSSTMTAHRQCFEAHFGNDVDGITCFSDAACPADQRCDLFNHRCVASSDAITDFYTCLEERLSSTVRIAFINFNNWTSAIQQRSFVDLLNEKYTSTALCMSTNFGHPYSPLRITFPVTTTFPGCPPCPTIALDQTFIPPPWCGNRVVLSSTCSYIFEPTLRNNFPSLCTETDTVCNWNSATDTAACTNPTATTTGTATQFCGVCESETSCVEVQAQSESDCKNIGEVCVLSDGTVDASLNASECALTYRCSQQCNGGLCTSEDACTNQGYCEDTEAIYQLLDSTYWAATHSRLGFCAFPMKPYNSPDCSTYIDGSSPSSFGCVAFGNCTTANYVLTCTVNYDSEASCVASGGTWYPKPTTQLLCETPVLCWAPEPLGSGGLSLTYYNFFVDIESCESCGGERRPVNKWVAGEWHPGTMRSVAWTNRSIVSPYGFNPSIDLASLVYDLSSTATLSGRAENLNNLQCSYNTLKKSALKLTCDCLTTDSPDTCFDISEDGVLGQGTLCPKTTSTIQAPPVAITTSSSNFASSLFNACVEFTLTTTLLPAFDPEPLVSVTIAFAKLRQKAERGSYRSVQNSQYAIVGQAIGDAVQITFTSSPEVSESLLSFSICLTLSTYVTPDTEMYPVYDFGKPLSDYTIRPLGIEVFYYSESNSLCGNISYGMLGDSLAFIPIVRLNSYKDISGPKLTDGQKACLIVVGSLFSLAFAVLFVQSTRVVLSSEFDWQRNTNLLWPCFGVLLLIRAIYMFLVAEEVLNLPNSHQLVDYFMMDFPMVLYLLANLLIGLSFVFLRMQQKNQDLPKMYFWGTLCCLAFLVIMLFISTLLAYRYQVLNKPPLSGPLLCPTVYDSTSTARTIRLIYESIILAIALMIGLVVLIVGASVWKQMAEVYGAERILVLCVVASVGIIGDSVAFLIYYIVDDPNPLFSIVLIFTEILPITFLVVQLSTTQMRQTQTSLSRSRRQRSTSASYSQ